MSTITLWKGYGMTRPLWVDALPDWVTEVEYQSSPHGYEVTMHHGCSTCFVFVPCVAPTDMDPDAYTFGELTWASPSCSVVVRSRLPWALKHISTAGTKSRVFWRKVIRIICFFGVADLIRWQVRYRPGDIERTWTLLEWQPLTLWSTTK